MIRLVVSRPVFEKRGAASMLIGYEYRIKVIDSNNPIVLNTDEKVMFALTVPVNG
jgi:hypothetical protein